jgi:uncharacterized protein YkwD
MGVGVRLAALVALVACQTAPPMTPAPPALMDRALDRLRAGHEASRLDEVARVAASTASTGFVVSAPAIKAAMASALGSGAWPHVLTAWGTGSQITARLEVGLAELRGAIEIAEVGFATARGPAGHVGAFVALPPPHLPLTVERVGSAARVKLRWTWGEDARIYAVSPAASWQLDATRTGDAIELALDCAEPPALEIRAGARVIATVLDACAPELAAGDPAPGIDIGPPARTPVELEMRLWELINRERVTHGAPPLAWDDASHRFARAHASDMAQFAYVAHESHDGASYAQRVAAAPFRIQFARENVGHAWGPGEVHDAFMASAGHRENLLSREVDRGAVGAAADPADAGAFYVTEFFRR